MENELNENDQIQTFVFFDIETSGLGLNARILELALVAISRDDLLSMCSKNDPLQIPDLPRVTHKFVKCFYPRRIITRTVEDICGLSNEILSHLGPFDDSTTKAIINFLNLPKPICLLAHNGNTFDFPFLKAEMAAAGVFDLDVQCIDTLASFRSIDIDIEDVNEAIRIFSEMPDYQFYDNDFKPAPITSIPNTSKDELTTIPTISRSKDNTYINEFKTPERKSSNQISSLKMNSKERSSTPIKIVQPYKKKFKTVKRRLVYKSYKQCDVYSRTYNSVYQAHCAEHDAIALLKICAYYGKYFTTWCDIHKNKFSSINPRFITKQPNNFMLN